VDYARSLGTFRFCPVLRDRVAWFRESLRASHIVAVHPPTFGANGTLQTDDFSYYRCGPHSAMLNSRGLEEHTFARLAAGSRTGGYVPEGYRIFHIFPNLVLAQYRLLGRWCVLVMQYLPAKVDETIIRTWSFATSFGVRRSGWARARDRLLDPPRGLALRYGIRKIVGEDAPVCVQLQRVAHQSGEAFYLGAEEERIGWFDEAYARAMSGASGLEAETISVRPSEAETI
jgi:hypothetical protein